MVHETMSGMEKMGGDTVQSLLTQEPEASKAGRNEVTELIIIK